MSKKVIGIDLGTGNSCVATIEHGQAVVITNAEGERTTPSVVTVTKDGERKVGSPAKRQQVVNAENTIYNIKRFMGSTYAKAADIASKMTYKVVNENGNPRVVMNGKNYSPEEISSFILAKMKKTAEDYLGEEITEAVITCPAWFDSAAREATKQAGEACGLHVLRVINEPTASVLAANIQTDEKGKIILVADIGQGTTDFSVCDISNADGQVVEIKASKGDVFLGGADFDNAIASWIVSECKAQNGADISKDSQAMQRVAEAAEKAKKELSTSLSSEINLPYITVVDSVPVHFTATLTRAKMDALTSGLVDRIITCAKEAVKAANVSYSQIDSILLVGGQSRSLAIQEALSKEFGVELNKSVNPDEAVAMGAAIQANIIVGGEGATDILLLDVTPLNLGIETLGGVMTNLIEANTTIPAKHTEVFTTAQDNQSAVTIHVLQGCRPMASDNKTIGMFNLEGIMPARKGVPKIEVTFDINANGILTVSAKDQATGKVQNVTIESKGTLSDDEVNRMKAEAEKFAAEDAKTKENLEKANKCEATIYSIDQIIENAGDKLTEEDKTYFNEKKEELKKMKENKTFDNLETLEQEIQGRMFAVSAKMYGANADASNMFQDMFAKGGAGFGQNFGNGEATANTDTTETATEVNNEDPLAGVKSND